MKLSSCVYAFLTSLSKYTCNQLTTAALIYKSLQTGKQLLALHFMSGQ